MGIPLASDQTERRVELVTCQYPGGLMFHSQPLNPVQEERVPQPLTTHGKRQLPPERETAYGRSAISLMGSATAAKPTPFRIASWHDLRHQWSLRRSSR